MVVWRAPASLTFVFCFPRLLTPPHVCPVADAARDCARQVGGHAAHARDERLADEQQHAVGEQVNGRSRRRLRSSQFSFSCGIVSFVSGLSSLYMLHFPSHFRPDVSAATALFNSFHVHSSHVCSYVSDFNFPLASTRRELDTRRAHFRAGFFGDSIDK